MFEQYTTNALTPAMGLMPDVNTASSLAPSALDVDPALKMNSRSASSASSLATASWFPTVPAPLESANNLGAFAETTAIATTGSVDQDDLVDYHRFQLINMGSVRLDLKNLQANADLRIIRDVNGNGRIDAGDELIGSRNLGTANESITLDGLGVGTYFAEVKSVTGSNTIPASTSYELSLNYRKGVRDFESEPNDSFLAPDFIGGNLNTTRHFRGLVSTTDQVDVYKFHVDTTTRFSATLSPDSGNANLQLVRDFNGNGVMDSYDLLNASYETGTLTDRVYSDRLVAGDYFLRVLNAGSGSTAYDLNVTGTPVTEAKFGVTLERIKAVDDLEGWGRGEADFYAYMTINGEKQYFNNSNLHNDDDITPNFNFTKDVSLDSRYIPFSIQVFETDGGGVLSSDAEHVDINPLAGQKDLTLLYDTLTGRVLGDELSPYRIYQEGESITLYGAGDSDRGMVTFRVNYSTYV